MPETFALRWTTADATVVPCESVAEWWWRHRSIVAEHPGTIHQAIIGGFAADRVGWAFASGYQAALRALVPDLPADHIGAFCVTEEGGNSPKAIQSTIRRSGDGMVLAGAKRWATLGPDGALFLVAARDADATGARPSLKLVRVASGLPGVSVEAMPPTRFIPEVPHARLQFDNVRLPAASVLPGDGYDRYVKPFRTVEDVHVQAAIFAYLMHEARRLSWPPHWIERLYALLGALCQLADMPPTRAETHLALAGVLTLGAGLIEEADKFWAAASADPAALRWRRDREILSVASGAREQRRQRAWETLRK